MKISNVIEELVEERSLDSAVLSAIICEGLLSAYEKKYPEIVFKVTYDKKTDAIQVFAEKRVVATAQEGLTEIGIRKARLIDEMVEVGGTVLAPFEGPIGRIEILKAKQVIAQKIRQIEAAATYNEFKPKEGTLVVGTIHKSERMGVTVKVGDTLAFLPQSLMIPGDKCIVGYTVRALLKEVLPEPRNDNQLILDRTSPAFLLQLLELEIPEIYEDFVEIKKIARIAGYKSKIVVASRDKNIDPVGACIGYKGSRIAPILKELGTEKIDVISEKDSLEDLLFDALKPAVVNRVAIADGKAQVWVNADQRSLAIGKLGQNIRLASELTGLAIDLVSQEGEKSVSQSENIDDDIANWDV